MSFDGHATLVVGAGSSLCGIPLSFVVETMRRQPLTPIANAPPFVSGLSVIRGQSTPVVDLGALIHGGNLEPRRMLVTLRVQQRLVALAVDRVLGVHQLEPETVGDLPPLLHASRSEAIEAIGVLDRELLIVLGAARIVSDLAWADPSATELQT